MKSLSLFVAIFLTCATAFSQDFLKGPAAKNTKVGKASTNNLSVVFDNNPQLVKGPNSKNFKVWKKESNAIQIRTRKNINNPKGLQAKNRKVWEESNRIEVTSKAAYQLPKSMKRRKIWWH
jgi:hypothetical protein